MFNNNLNFISIKSNKDIINFHHSDKNKIQKIKNLAQACNFCILKLV